MGDEEILEVLERQYRDNIDKYPSHREFWIRKHSEIRLRLKSCHERMKKATEE